MRTELHMCPLVADFVAEVVGAEWAIGILKTMVSPILPLAPTSLSKDDEAALRKALEGV